MTLTPQELRSLDDVAAELRRTDPALCRALVTGKPPRARWSVWCIVYIGGSLLMLALAAVAGASLVGTAWWLCLVSAGSAAVRAQDRADVNRPV